MVLVTVHITFNVRYLTCDCAFESFVKYHVIFANVAFVTTSDGTLSTVVRMGMFQQYWRFSQIFIMFQDGN